MRWRRVLLAGVLAVVPALSSDVVAQPAPDPIGSLLDRSGQPSPDTDEPDAAEDRQPATPDPADTLPAGPQPYRAAPKLTEPVRIDETGKSPDAPMGPRELAYEARIRSSGAAAQRYQGPLDGGWVLVAGGVDTFSLQISDKGEGAIEAAWRDLRRPGGLSASGFVDRIESQGPDLTLSFQVAGGQPVQAVLHAGYDGGWSGEVTERGARVPAQLRRKQ